MEQLQSVNNVSFQAQAPKAKKSAMQAPVPPPSIENGDEKSMNALKWAGAIGAATLAVGGTVYAVKHPEKLKNIGDKVKKTFKGVKSNAAKATKMSAKEANEASMKTVKNVSEQAQTTVTDLKKAVGDLQAKKTAYASQQALVDKAQAKVDDLTKKIQEAAAKGEKTSKLEGLLGNAKGELSKQKAALSKMSNVTDADIQKAGQAVSEAAKKSPENAAVVKMQRAKRKHPELSDESAKKLFDSATASKPKVAAQADAYDKYLDHCAKTKKANIMSKAEFLKAQQRNEYRKYVANLTADGKMGPPVSFEQFLKTNYN